MLYRMGANGGLIKQDGCISTSRKHSLNTEGEGHQEKWFGTANILCHYFVTSSFRHVPHISCTYSPFEVPILGGAPTIYPHNPPLDYRFFWCPHYFSSCIPPYLMNAPKVLFLTDKKHILSPQCTRASQIILLTRLCGIPI